MKVIEAGLVQVLRLNPRYWYAEVKGASGVRLAGRGDFECEETAKRWAQGVAHGEITPAAEHGPRHR
jgi:hypothetical protein